MPSQLALLEAENPHGDPSDEIKLLTQQQFIKPLPKIVNENTDITRLVSQLSSIVMANRHDVSDVLATFCGYEELWRTVRRMHDFV